MKTVTVKEFGGPEVLTVTEAPEIQLTATQVAIAVEAIGVGFVDKMFRTGMYPGLPGPGFVPGIEVAGTIVSVGAAADPALKGRRVFAMLLGGGYAEQVAVEAAQVVPLPNSVSATDAVALGVNYAVAKLSCDRAQVASGKRVLVRGAGGGIGALATQVAARSGATVVVTTSSAERGEKLRELGANEVFNRKAGAQPTDDGFDAVIDPVAGEDTSALLAQLNPNGHYIVCGIAAGLPAPDFGISLLMNFQKSVSVATFSLNSVEPAALFAAFAEGFEALASGSIQPVVAGVLPLADAAEAHRQLDAGQVFGKIILKP